MGGIKGGRSVERRHGAPRGRARDREHLARILSERLGARAMRVLRRAGALARSRGEHALLVGGCVRDLLLDRASRDLDLVVEGDALELGRALAGALGGVQREHAAFGTASIELPDGVRLDLATARRESYARPAALPRVEAADLRSDLLRRDFTVNCLALDLAPGRFAELVDPCGGRRDLEAGLVRVLHERSFTDDPTRVFRALRLAARLGFRPAPRTAHLIREALREGMVERLSAARLRREVASALDGPQASATAAVLERFGVWERVDPALRVGVRERGRLDRLRLYPAAVPGAGWAASLALIAFERTLAQRRRLVRRLQPDRRSVAALLDAPAEARAVLRALGRAADPRPGTVWAACQGRSELALALAWTVTRSARVRRLLSRYVEDWSAARADIDGTDLLAAGVPRGPGVARGLRAALRAKLDGRAPEREAQLGTALRAARRRA